MMPWTAQALCDPAAGCSRIGDMLGSDPTVLAVLGIIALMGAWGNHVFFMISGSDCGVWGSTPTAASTAMWSEYMRMSE